MEYTQGCWVEIQNKRIAGGVSVEFDNWQGGLGAVVDDQIVGLTGYVQYQEHYLLGRLQLDYLINQIWQPQVSLGVPFNFKDFKIEPHLSLGLEANQPKARIGLRVQYQF